MAKRTSNDPETPQATTDQTVAGAPDAAKPDPSAAGVDDAVAIAEESVPPYIDAIRHRVAAGDIDTVASLAVEGVAAGIRSLRGAAPAVAGVEPWFRKVGRLHDGPRVETCGVVRAVLESYAARRLQWIRQ